MRIGYKKFKEIKKWYGSSDFEIGYDTDALTITENLVDDDDDCGALYNYKISDKRFG